MSASFSGWTSTNERANISSGGLRLPSAEDGLYQSDPPRALSACKAVTLRGATDKCLSKPKKISVKLHLNRSHSSARQLRRVSVNPDGDDVHLVTHAGGVLGQCEVRRSFDDSPHVSSAGAATASMFIEKLRVDPLFSDDPFALRAVDAFSKYLLFVPARSKNP